jgi:DNA-binding transcriptional ArsR family regulator
VTYRVLANAGCDPGKSPQVDGLLDTLSDETRREIVRYFENTSDGQSATIEELVDYLTARIPHADQKLLETMLWHQHLPVLRERGWIEIDYREDQIRYRNKSEARQFLQDLVAVFD